MPTQKISPPTHSSHQKSDPALRAEAEADLADTARVADPGARGADEDSIDAGNPAPPPGGAWPEQPPGAFEPADAARFRVDHAAVNRLGKPRPNSTAEELLLTYQRTLREHREEYARGGQRSLAKERPFLEAKQAMIDAGLMKGDV